MTRAPFLLLALVACGGGDEVDTEVSVPSRCETLELTETPFVAGTGELNGLADDFAVETRGGGFAMSEDWSGCDTLIFIPSEPRQNGSFSVDMWAADHAELLANSPPNVHYFFVPNADTSMEARLDIVQAGIGSALIAMSDEEVEDWQTRVHFVTATPTGWLGEMLANPGWGVVIDRAQGVRYMGSFADKDRYDGGVGWFAPNLGNAANEARYANFTVDRQERLDAEDVTVVSLWDGETVQGSPRLTTELPDAATMAGFDTLEFDLTAECVGEGEFGDCPAWDYLVYLYQCDDAVAAVDAFADTVCQPFVAEVVGACTRDGTTTTDTCRSDDDCDDSIASVWACGGFAPSIAADTQEGACEDPLDAASAGTYTCNDQGTGYADLVCPCGTETGRWITTYHREGRWVHDATPFLALLQKGGATQFRFQSSQPYELKLDFRLSNRDLGVRPTSMQRLYRGGYYSPTLNDSYAPLDLQVPAGAVRVELASVISGHGGGQFNCGEFCHTTNHFFVNGAEIVVEDPWVDENDGCEQQVDFGTVPNQYGTWWYGRNGWCPGKEVPVTRFDITTDAPAGTTVTFDHETFGPNGQVLNGGGGERIEVESWMVVYE